MSVVVHQGQDHDQLISAKIAQRSLTIIAPMTFAVFCLGTLAHYEQNLGLYSSFTTCCTVLVVKITVLHVSSSENVRNWCVMVKNKIVEKIRRPASAGKGEEAGDVDVEK